MLILYSTFFSMKHSIVPWNTSVFQSTYVLFHFHFTGVSLNMPVISAWESSPPCHLDTERLHFAGDVCVFNFEKCFSRSQTNSIKEKKITYRFRFWGYFRDSIFSVHKFTRNHFKLSSYLAFLLTINHQLPFPSLEVVLGL